MKHKRKIYSKRKRSDMWKKEEDRRKSKPLPEFGQILLNEEEEGAKKEICEGGWIKRLIKK